MNRTHVRVPENINRDPRIIEAAVYLSEDAGFRGYLSDYSHTSIKDVYQCIPPELLSDIIVGRLIRFWAIALESGHVCPEEPDDIVLESCSMFAAGELIGHQGIADALEHVGFIVNEEEDNAIRFPCLAKQQQITETPTDDKTE